MTSRAAPILALAASLVAAVLAGALLLAPRPPPAPAPASPRQTITPPVLAPPLVAVPRGAAGGVSADQVRAILREELDARTAAPAAPAADEGDRAEAEAELQVTSSESQRAARRAGAIVAAAVERGTWTEADRDALRPEIGRLRGADVQALLRELVPAINNGRVRPTFDGPPI